MTKTWLDSIEKQRRSNVCDRRTDRVKLGAEISRTAVSCRQKVMKKTEQESCAIANMTAQCALHMGALKIFGTP